jgi:hypothetical protein
MPLFGLLPGVMAQMLPAFTERVIVADNGIDAEWQGEFAEGKAGEVSFLRAGCQRLPI